MCQVLCGEEVVFDDISIPDAREILASVKYPQPFGSPPVYIRYTEDECNQYAYCKSMEFGDVKAFLNSLQG